MRRHHVCLICGQDVGKDDLPEEYLSGDKPWVEEDGVHNLFIPGLIVTGNGGYGCVFDSVEDNVFLCGAVCNKCLTEHRDRFFVVRRQVKETCKNVVWGKGEKR